ncbi:site-2 protease family protein [Candidatus Sumerlaeota bacterium]|nr:site-2 protease family protein [Candidatus Sumerlaeota bacterium]
MNLHITPYELLALPVLLFSIICHEVGHAYAAYRGGDDTARLQGRLSFNPLVHIDPIGTVLVPLILILSPVRLPLVGWAKPVPINTSRLRSAKWNLIVSVAGVAMNWALILGACIVMRILLWFDFVPTRSPGGGQMTTSLVVFVILQHFILINLLLMIFNLIPIPPLDGSHVLFHFIRTRDSIAFQAFQFLERYGFLILLLLLWMGVLGRILWPILSLFIAALGFIFQMRILWVF